ncbi:MAG: RNA-binding protein [Prochloron sp. SP5CPC1]|nr:RNA-binding protein [Candidatus Paraprochloron terpiosi SP5CPC1]
MSIRLYVGNLPKEEIDHKALQDMFADAGEDVSIKVIKDRKTGKCRGFAFVTVPSDEVADTFIEKYNGLSFMDSTLKIEKALPRAKNQDKEEKSTEGTELKKEPKPVPVPNKVPTNTVKRSKQRSKRQSQSPLNNKGADSIQPDPRWAAELAQLKERLAAQPTNV